ncbi:HAMP domain-containing histidine kinase [Ancylomarina salipaludis]|uniref:histidine kinase n=1 Tax=Ancylomarina salipaludis TaxID=2501299 RepID=A0A4Q1JL28_9BACT|nr:HAMP domain-containing sensor histidine kinase [Ancylomarina salipaludis]RXQ94386.1 HAMP domain-containing histidine kinase [Ancylomarina salipaludis]
MYPFFKKNKFLNLKVENRVAAIYIFFGALWIIASDEILLLFNFDAGLLTHIQTYKGWFFVLMTGLLIHILIKNDRKNEIQLQEKLKEAIIKSRESDRLKSAFLSNISHELRTPLNSIQGFSELLKNPKAEACERDEYIDYINEGSIQLLAILNDLIEISKLESNLTHIDNKDFCIVSLLHELYPIYKFELEMNSSKKLSFDLNLPNDNPFLIKSDRFRVKQIITHFLSNAIKFTQEGKIELGFTEHKDSVSIYVRDTGIGIDKDKLLSVMKPFVQSDMTSKKSYGGVGIGLTLCQELSLLLHGELKIDSELGKGTCISLVLPNADKKDEIVSQEFAAG